MYARNSEIWKGPFLSGVMVQCIHCNSGTLDHLICKRAHSHSDGGWKDTQTSSLSLPLQSRAILSPLCLRVYR